MVPVGRFVGEACQPLSPVERQRLGDSDLLQHVSQSFGSAHEVAAGHVGAVQARSQRTAIRPFIHDVENTEVRPLHLVQTVILAQDIDVFTNALELGRSDGDGPGDAARVVPRFAVSPASGLVYQ